MHHAGSRAIVAECPKLPSDFGASWGYGNYSRFAVDYQRIFPIDLSACKGSASPAALFVLFGNSFQLRNTRFDILDLDGFGGMTEYAIRRSHPRGRRRGRINHDF